jgi:hypothetical protein
MESCKDLTFPGYVPVTELAHATYGSELFFSSREDFLLATTSTKHPNQYRLAPDHFKLLISLGTSASLRFDDVERPAYQSIISDSDVGNADKLLLASDTFLDSASATASTISVNSEAVNFPSLHSSNPN